MMTTIRVAIVEDHQSIIDGYLYRLQDAEGLEVVGVTHYGEEVETLLEEKLVDILILDAQIPTSATNLSPYPILLLMPQLLETYPQLNILIISMHKQRSFIEYALEAGASGYVLKDDYQTIKSIEEVLRLVAAGGIHFSREVLQPLLRERSGDQILTQRQLQVLSLCAAYPNETTAELALRLNVAHSTVRNLLSQSYLRLGIRSRNAAITEAHRRGLILLQE
jgi:DNA-binding NarL/FixJ family response regulator